jgi:hypothetical protein
VVPGEHQAAIRRQRAGQRLVVQERARRVQPRGDHRRRDTRHDDDGQGRSRGVALDALQPQERAEQQRQRHAGQPRPVDARLHGGHGEHDEQNEGGRQRTSRRPAVQAGSERQPGRASRQEGADEDERRHGHRLAAPVRHVDHRQVAEAAAELPREVVPGVRREQPRRDARAE